MWAAEKKWSEWWNEEVGLVVAEKRILLRNGNREDMGSHMIDSNRAQKAVVKHTVKVTVHP